MKKMSLKEVYRSCVHESGHALISYLIGMRIQKIEILWKDKWFAATYLLCEAKKGMSACQIQRTLGISYKTAWYLCHRIRAAMMQADRPMLSGKVEMDE